MLSSILLCFKNLEALGNGDSSETGKAEISNMTIVLSCLSLCFLMYSVYLFRFLGHFNHESTLHSQFTKKEGLNNEEIEHNNCCHILHYVKDQQLYTEKPYSETVLLT